jgi:hypothetical protein
MLGVYRTLVSRRGVLCVKKFEFNYGTLDGKITFMLTAQQSSTKQPT